MNRRGFIGTLLGGIFTAAEIAADPDKLLWTPKLISIPTPTPVSGFAFSKAAFALTPVGLPTPIKLDNMFSVDFEFTEAELSISHDYFMRHFVEPAIKQHMEYDLIEGRGYFKLS